MAYQATNSTRNTGPGSLYSDICLFAADITRERTSIATRNQAAVVRKRLLARQEREEAREYAAAHSLASLKRSGNKVRRLYYFEQLGLIKPLKAKIVLTLGSKSPDSHSPASTEMGSSVSDDDMPQPAQALTYLDDLPASEEDMPMLVDSPHEARSSSFPIPFVSSNWAYRPSDLLAGPARRI
jgi:hypothetical protein